MTNKTTESENQGASTSTGQDRTGTSTDDIVDGNAEEQVDLNPDTESNGSGKRKRSPVDQQSPSKAAKKKNREDNEKNDVIFINNVTEKYSIPGL